jgi:hypothetical protein
MYGTDFFLRRWQSLSWSRESPQRFATRNYAMDMKWMYSDFSAPCYPVIHLEELGNTTMKLISGHRPRFKPGTSRIEFRRVTAALTCLVMARRYRVEVLFRWETQAIWNSFLLWRRAISNLIPKWETSCRLSSTRGGGGRSVPSEKQNLAASWPTRWPISHLSHVLSFVSHFPMHTPSC